MDIIATDVIMFSKEISRLGRLTCQSAFIQKKQQEVLGIFPCNIKKIIYYK